MFTVIQFPFADARPFLQLKTQRLNSPSWPGARPEEDFVRAFGAVKRRRKGGIEDWEGEDLYCNAVGPIKFPWSSTRLQGLSSNGKLHIKQTCAFRRFWADGGAVARMEIGFRYTTTTEGELASPKRRFWSLPARLPWLPMPSIRLRGQDCLNLIYQILELPVIVRTGKTASPRELLGIADPLAKAYLAASTRKGNGKLPPPAVEDWWLRPGIPLLVLEYSKDEEIRELPKYTRYVQSEALNDASISLSFLRVALHNREVSVWLVGSRKVTPPQLLRQLRLNLFRFHAELEALKQIFRLIRQEKIIIKRGSPSTEKLQRYLDQTVRLFTKVTQDGLPQSAIFDVVQSAQSIISEGERATLLGQLSAIRRNLLNNVKKFLDQSDRVEEPIYNINNPQQVSIYHIKNVENMSSQSINITNSTVGDINQVAAQNINDSFKKIAESSLQPELKNKMNELASAVAEMCKQLPKDSPSQQQVTQDLKTLTTEAASASPRRKWYELSAEGLIEAAKTVGKIGEPVITAAKAVLALLA